jgi:hypothetical protein
MRKLILSIAVAFAMSSFSVFAQDAKPVKKEGAKTEQCCKKDAKDAKEAKACCKKEAKADGKACCKEEAKKKIAAKTTGDKK